MNIDILLQPALSALATLAAAFSGARYAFHLQGQARARWPVEDRVAAGNRAIFVLIRQFNTLKTFQTQIIDPVRDDPGAFLNIRASLPFSYDSLTVDFDSLSFLLETNHRQVLGELFIEEERFRSAIQAINERWRIHLNICQPLLEGVGIIEGGEYTPEQIQAALGHCLVLQLKRAMDAVVQHVDKTVESSLAVGEKLYTVQKSLFPKHSIIRFEPDTRQIPNLTKACN
jgi:hypothetical protein